MGLTAAGKEAAKAALLPLAWLARRAGRAPQRVVLVLGHMRSGSSLLHHLLISHPGVQGRGERNQPYRSEVDLDRLLVDVWAHRRRLPPADVALCDQVNHGRLLADEGLLLHDRVRKVFVLREPRPAVASMVNVLGRLNLFPVERAADYYVARLDELRRYANADPHPARQFLVSYESLTGPGRHALLRDLSAFLRLEPALTEDYRVFDFTGTRGDTSERIRSGRIVAGASAWNIEIPPALEEALEQAHAECLAALVAHCSSPQGRVLPSRDQEAR